MNIKQVLGYDIETAPKYDDHASAEEDVLRFVGFRLPSGIKVVYEHPQQREAIQNTISNYRYITGHNIEDRTYNSMQMGYDNKVMKRHGYKFETRDKQKIVFFDTQKIAEKRAKAMMYIKLGQGQFNLRYLTEFFNLVDDTNRKGDFDYYLLRKPYLSPQERKDLIEYLHRDLESQWKLFEYFYNNFSGILPRLSTTNQINGQWLNGATGTTGYRWYCNLTGLPEAYDWDLDKGHYSGAEMYVDPNQEMAEDLLVNDFASLYPSMMSENNLYSRYSGVVIEKDGKYYSEDMRPLWHGGNEVFPSVEQDGVKGIVGYYYADEMGVFEKGIQDAFKERTLAKQNFKITGEMKYHYEQLGIKILMNASYGASGSVSFKSMYDKITAEDITRSGKCCITHARKYLEDRGYWIIYLHTDSLYTVDVYHDNDKLKAICNEITEIQKKCLNMESVMHSFEFEKKIEKLWLTKGDDGENLMQRNFIIYKDKQGVMKADFTGGKLAAFNTSELAKKVWKDVISQDLINGKRDLYYKPETLLMLIKDYSKENPELLKIRKKAKGLSSYKSLTSQPAKICLKYGCGEHFLIPNKYVGVSSYGGKKFLGKMEELEELFGADWISAVDFSQYLQELSVFVRPEQRKLLAKLDN